MMFGAYWVYQIPLWVLFFFFAIVLLIPLEVGLQLGKRQKRLHPAEPGESRSDITLTAMLTLLALMLAFTYSFSMSRADLRKQALLDEVNAIGTAFVRADLLPEPGSSEVRQRLLEYAQSRVVDPSKVITLEHVEQVVRQSVEIQAKIWPAVKRAMREPGEMTNPEKALLVSAINDVLDAHTSRMAVFFDRLPTAVLVLLLLIAGTALGFAGYNATANGQPIRWRLLAFALILASLIYIILDFDMMMRGFIQVDHTSLIQLVDSMQTALEHP
ncbi:MAG: hypothetical protein NXI32_16655 [bacterium]|nr:hypothetical protein [bacterium]